jgi:small subunit ribosomal protein S6
MRHYELLVILKPTLTDEEKSSQVDFLKDLLAKNEALIEVIEDKGTRNLAYEIQKHKRGHYYVIYFKAPSSSIAEIERMIRFNEEIIKFMTVKYENKKEIAFWETLSNNVKKTLKKAEEKTESSETPTPKKEEEKSEEA